MNVISKPQGMKWNKSRWVDTPLKSIYQYIMSTRHQLYGHLPPITKTIQVRRTRHAGHCWRSRGAFISDVLLWTPTYVRAKAGRPARTYIQQLCEDTGYSPEDLRQVINDREKWRERARDICAGGTAWWRWWLILILLVGAVEYTDCIFAEEYGLSATRDLDKKLN